MRPRAPSAGQSLPPAGRTTLTESAGSEVEAERPDSRTCTAPCGVDRTIGGQKSRLVELMEAIQVTQKEQDRHKEILSEQSAHIQEARALLEQLRPVMDTLGGELDK